MAVIHEENSTELLENGKVLTTLSMYINGNNEHYEGLFFMNIKGKTRYSIRFITFKLENLIETFSNARDSEIPFLRKGYECAEQLKAGSPKTTISRITAQPTCLFWLPNLYGTYTLEELDALKGYFISVFEKKPDYSLEEIAQGSA